MPPMASAAPAGNNKRPAALIFILVVVLIDIMGIGLIVPVLPGLVKKLSGSEAGAALSIGLLTAAFAIMQFLMAPLLGKLSDRYGRRPVLLVATAGMAVDYLVMYFAPSLFWLFVGRIIAGATAATLTVINAYIADVTPPEERSAQFGKVGAVVGLGFVLGPALGGLLGEYGLRMPFLVAAVIAGFSWLYGYFVLPESLKPENRAPRLNVADLNPFKPLLALKKHAAILRLAAALVVVGLSLQSIYSIWVLYTETVIGWTPRQNGVALAVSGILGAVAQGALLRPFLQRMGERRGVLLALLFGVVEFALLAVAKTDLLLWISLVVGAVASLAQPAIQGYISRLIPDNEQGQVQGAISALGSLVAVAGPLLYTAIFAHFTVSTAAVHFPGAPFAVAALLGLIGWFLTMQAMRKNDAIVSESVQ